MTAKSEVAHPYREAAPAPPDPPLEILPYSDQALWALVRGVERGASPERILELHQASLAESDENFRRRIHNSLVPRS